MAVLLALSAFLSFTLLVLALVVGLNLRRQSPTSRLAAVADFQRELLSAPLPRGSSARWPDGGPIQLGPPSAKGAVATARLWLSQSALGRWSANLAERDLDRTDWALTPTVYLGRRTLVLLISAGLGWLLTRGHVEARFIGALAGAVASQVVWDRVVAYQIGRYRQRIAQQSEQVIEILMAHLRAGQSLAQSLTALADEAPDPSNEEYRRVVRQVALGAPASEALRWLQERVPIESVSLLVSALNLHRRIGGDLPMLLRIAADTIRDQIRLRDELATTAAGQVLASYVVLALPVCLFGVMLVVDRPYIEGILQPGWNLLLVAGAIMEVTGYFVMRSFTRIEL